MDAADDVEDESLAWMLERVGKGTGTREELTEVYGELRELAAVMMRAERRNHTLQPTALVNEAFVRISSSRNLDGADRLRLMDAAAVAMRRILVDHARRARADKRGADWERVTLQGLAQDPESGGEVDLLDLQCALEQLERLDPRAGRIVELRFFGGLSGEEIASHLGISRPTVVRELSMARAWLRRALDPATD